MKALLSRIERPLLVAALAVGLASVSIVHAATFPNLYRVTVMPDPAATDQRGAAIQAAMAKLLIRVTGNLNAPLDPTLQDMLADASSYLSSYGSDLKGQAQVGFFQGRVEQALTARNMPVWGPERPLTLLWIAVDDGLGGRALLSANGTADEGVEPSPEMSALVEQLRTELLTVADERGIPITFPLLDLEDLNTVTFADVWGGFDDRVALASARYGTDAILIGRVRPGLLGTEVQWLLRNGGERRVLAGVAPRDGLDAAADAYAAELSTVGEASVSAVTILNVSSSADYARVISYLEKQSVLQSVDVDSFANGVLTLRVAARGDARVLERILALGGVLRPASRGGGSGAAVFEVARSEALQ